MTDMKWDFIYKDRLALKHQDGQVRMADLLKQVKLKREISNDGKSF